MDPPPLPIESAPPAIQHLFKLLKSQNESSPMDSLVEFERLAAPELSQAAKDVSSLAVRLAEDEVIELGRMKNVEAFQSKLLKP